MQTNIEIVQAASQSSVRGCNKVPIIYWAVQAVALGLLSLLKSDLRDYRVRGVIEFWVLSAMVLFVYTILGYKSPGNLRNPEEQQPLPVTLEQCKMDLQNINIFQATQFQSKAILKNSGNIRSSRPSQLNLPHSTLPNIHSVFDSDSFRLECLQSEKGTELSVSEKIVSRVAPISESFTLPQTLGIGPLENHHHMVKPMQKPCQYLDQFPISPFQVEKTFCPICKIIQPLRTKHCRSCDCCVPTFDHHCKWMGNCIGEKNRAIFLGYIILQFSQCCWALILGVFCLRFDNNIQEWILNNFLTCFFIGFCAYFTIFMGILIAFQLYLLCFNLTTWEFLSWSHIPYLEKWNPEEGPPFSGSCPRNWNALLFNQCDKKIIEWQMPTRNENKRDYPSCFMQGFKLFRWICI